MGRQSVRFTASRIALPGGPASLSKGGNADIKVILSAPKSTKYIDRVSNTISNYPAIQAEALNKIYYIGVRRRKVTALRNVAFEVLPGEVFAFLGLNGAGKTTTIKLLLDHARPTSGRSLLLGIDSRNPKSRKDVGYMPDLPNFYRFLTAAELLDHMGKLHGLTASERTAKIAGLLGRVGLSGREKEPLEGFSRGMLQRLGIAQALIGDPALLILDEPLGGLDPIGRFEFHKIILELKAEGRTIFFSSHILEDAEKIADRVAIIHKGELLGCGPLEELIHGRPEWDIGILGRGNSELLNHWKNIGAVVSSLSDDRLLVTVLDDVAKREVLMTASQSDLQIVSVLPKRRTLEEAFLAELRKWDR